MNINQSFNSEKVQKMRNLGNVYICGSPFVMSRTDAQNGLDSIFKIRTELVQWSMYLFVVFRDFKTK